MSGHLGRSVSIIGVGYSPIGNVLKTEGIIDLTERELFAWAALEAMEDCGLTGKDIEAFYVGQSATAKFQHQGAASATLADWIGMRYKPNISHDEACVSSHSGLNQAVMAVASGMYDIVLSGGTQVNQAIPIWGYPPHIRVPHDDLWATMNVIAGDSAYVNPGTAMMTPLDAAPVSYAKKYNVSFDNLRKAMASAAIIARKNGVNNPKALYSVETYEEEARRAGFDDVFAYFNSPYNPPMGTLSSVRYCAPVSDGASALIVCETEKAKKLVKQPIEVIGFGAGCATANQQIGCPWEPELLAFKAAYDMANITDPYNEIDYLAIHDCNAQHYFTVTETAGYFKPGEGWKAVIEGRIAHDGDKPVNTSGGRLACGHPLGGSVGIEIAEAVYQMRGESGPRQMPKPPRLTVVQSFGGGFHTNVSVLRSVN